ncbi:MAG: ABC transporter substrate-binding protein [Colwellia sp.]|nr:ABC transporter substrate-binding protein [Colwellia sp.]
MRNTIKSTLCLLLVCFLANGQAQPIPELSRPTIVLGTTNAIETPLYQKAFRVLTSAFDALGYRLVIKTLPNKRSLLWANSGKIDGELFRISELNLTEFDQLSQVNEPLFVIDQTVFSKQKINVSGWDSLKEYVLTYERGTRFIEKKHDKFKGTILVNSTQQAMALIYHDRADITITSRETGNKALLKNKLFAKVVLPQFPPLTTITLHTYINKNNHPYLAQELSKQLVAMKCDGSFERLISNQ